MAEFSNYPNKIDTTAEIPKATDNVTPVKAELFNRLRDAIIAVENELGIQPSSTYSTVKARLDALEQGIGSGGGGSGMIPAKIRAYRTTPLTGAVANTSKTVSWDGTSDLLSASNASIIGSSIPFSKLTTTKDGTYAVDGQLTIEPTAGVVGGITVDVKKDGNVIHTLSDSGAVWGIGIPRSFSFSLKTEISASSTISVEWKHIGNIGSATQLNSGDQFSWLSILKLQ